MDEWAKIDHLMKKWILVLPLLFLPGILIAAPDPLEKVAKELADGIGTQRQAKVAVVGIAHHDNHKSDGPALVSERLTTYLAKDKRFHVVERNQIAQILSELRLSETGLINRASAKRIGEGLGADVIVTGTLIDLGNQKTELNARALFSGTGRVIAASRTLLDRTWLGRRNLGRQ